MSGLEGLDRFELEARLNERAAAALSDYLHTRNLLPPLPEAEARLEDAARDIVTAYGGVYGNHYIDDNGVLQVEARADPEEEILAEIIIEPWVERDDVEDHPVKCANCDETASGLVNPGSDYIHRIVCSHCGYKEDR